MPRMKLTKEEFDPKALDVKVDKSNFKRYTGEIPRNGTILICRVTRMWWTQSKAGDSQIYLMAFAEQNKGALKQYNGLPIRERLTFIPDAAFRYQNFLHNFGLTTRDIYNKMEVEAEPDNIGDIITSIAGWEVGSDDALCRIVVVRDRYDPDELKAKVDRDGWLPLDEDDELDEDEDEDDDLEDELEDEEDDVEEEETEDQEQEYEEQEDEEEEPPARTSRSRNTGRTVARTRPAPARTSSRRDGERTRTSRASTARTERTPGPRGSKGRDGGSREDPPF